MQLTVVTVITALMSTATVSVAPSPCTELDWPAPGSAYSLAAPDPGTVFAWRHRRPLAPVSLSVPVRLKLWNHPGEGSDSPGANGLPSKHVKGLAWRDGDPAWFSKHRRDGSPTPPDLHLVQRALRRWSIDMSVNEFFRSLGSIPIEVTRALAREWQRLAREPPFG